MVSFKLRAVERIIKISVILNALPKLKYHFYEGQFRIQNVILTKDSLKFKGDGESVESKFGIGYFRVKGQLLELYYRKKLTKRDLI